MFKHIKYQGKDYPIRISYYALKMLQIKTGKSITDPSKVEYDAYEDLLFYSLKKGHEKAEVPFTLKRAEMEDFMDEVFFDFVKMIPEFFNMDEKPNAAGDAEGGEAKK